jgi:hypothetical protein
MRKKYRVTNPKAGAKTYNLIGKEFGYLTVTSFVGLDTHKNKIWLCLCKCGNTCNVTTTYLNNGKTTSCKCNRYKKGNQVYNYSGFKDISGKKWNSIKNNAKKRGLDFLITKEFIWGLYNKQNRKCYFTGIDIDYIKGTASIDRKDNNIGYLEGNVIMVHKDVNLMRNKFSIKYFIQICELITNNSFNIKT